MNAERFALATRARLGDGRLGDESVFQGSSGLRPGSRDSRMSVRRSARPSRLSRVRLWVPLFLVFWLGVWTIESLSRGVLESGFTTIDTRCSHLAPAPDEDTRTSLHAFIDDRWNGWLAERLARLPATDSLESEGVRGLSEAVTALPFVAEVGQARVVWPDGFEIPVRLRIPVACVMSGEEYLAVSAEGVILPGPWPAPPWIGSGFLPVIGPNDRTFDRARAGDVLREARHLDALAVAISMRQSLGQQDFELMGPPLVDATRARVASVVDPGVLIRLEARRVVYFGRSPRAGMPGELPSELKWKSLGRALSTLKAGEAQRDWSLVDVRWDVPAIEWRDARDAPNAVGG